MLCRRIASALRPIIYRSPSAAFLIAEPVEHKQPMAAGAGEVPIPGGAFLISMESMSSTTALGGCRACPRSIHCPDRSRPVRGGYRHRQGTLSPIAPSGRRTRPARLRRARRQSIASRDRIPGGRRRLRPHSHRGGRRWIGETIPSSRAGRSCRCADRQAHGRPCPSSRACHQARGRPAIRRRW